MHMKKKIAAACVAAMAAFSLPMGIVPVQPVQADLITDVIGGFQVKSALSKQIKHYDTTKEGQSEIYQSVTKQTGVLNNSYYDERLASIMNRLSASIAQTDPSIKTLPYRWYVSPDTTFNAACTMGHVMVVNKGMFDLVSNDDEIAVVLGHEMGHGQKHHVANSTQKKVNVEIGKMVLADTIGGSGLNNLILNTVSNQIETVHIDRAAEWEADNLSFGYITRAGYNPGATAAIWQRVMEKQGDNASNFVGEIFSPSDHPSNQERRDNYERQTRQRQRRHGLRQRQQIHQARSHVQHEQCRTVLFRPGQPGRSLPERPQQAAGHGVRRYALLGGAEHHDAGQRRPVGRRIGDAAQ
ncbi:M48 family metallopeptidase [Megasphaera sp.]|uniref:M48 family metallopeptidase n=1 Tax=Megasphaera sp. TaxID=2023260 RepID=UPI003FD8173E